jgi:N-acetylmuramoyl-L-alanine amidase
MSQKLMDRGQIVGYDFEKKQLVVTIGEKIANKMRADGWVVHYEDELGHFVILGYPEGE